MNLLARLSVAQRFILLVVLCGTAILVPTITYALHVWGDTQSLLREREGLAPYRSLSQVVRLTQQHRGLSGMWLGGQEGQAAARAAKAAEVDKAIEALQVQFRADAAFAGSPLEKEWGDARQAWVALQADIGQRKLDGPASFARHTALVSRLLHVNDHALAHWGLVYDPAPDDYFVVIGALQETPRTIELAGQLRGRGAAMLSAPDKVTAAERGVYGTLAATMREQIERVSYALGQSVAIAPAHATALKDAVRTLQDNAQATVAQARQHVVEPDTHRYSGTVFFGDMSKSIDAMYAALGTLEQLLALNLQERADAAVRGLVWVVVLGGALFVVALCMAAHTGRWIRQRLGAEPGALQAAVVRVAEGDLATPVLVRPGDQSSVMAAMGEMQRSLSHLVGGVRSNADAVATASGQIAQGNLDLSTRTESQASALQQTAASMEQLRTTIGSSADSARQASQLATQASEVAARGGGAVGELADTMARIQESSRRIAEIIGTIDSIAFQTNILALNAAVEAARAGEQGRGFAVVASEVRALAQRSAGAAREIRTLIADSVERVEQGSRQGSEAAATMQEVVTSIRRVNDLIGEVSSAAQEQTAGVALASDAVAQMDETTQRNAALVEQSAAAAESLRHQANALQKAVASFRVAGALAPA